MFNITILIKNSQTEASCPVKEPKHIAGRKLQFRFLKLEALNIGKALCFQIPYFTNIMAQNINRSKVF
jgi:hypothetical protein